VPRLKSSNNTLKTNAIPPLPKGRGFLAKLPMIFSNLIGDAFDGTMTLEEFKEATKTTLDFSEAVDDSWT